MKKIIALVTALLVIFAMSVTVANASGKTAECTPKAAYTEVVKHPAVTHVVHTDEVTQVVADQRYAWNPKGPQNETDGPGPGSTPLTDPDHWQANTSHYNGTDPIGSAFQEGHGNGGDNASWFYWTGKTVVITPASDVTVVDQLETTDVITHEAVTCATIDDKPVVKHHVTYEPAPVPTTKPKHVVTPTLVHAGF